MNEVFADGKALILKKDGMSMGFLFFANQNELHDLNLIDQLKRLKVAEDKNPIEIVNTQKESDARSAALFTIFLIIIIGIIISLLKQ